MVAPRPPHLARQRDLALRPCPAASSYLPLTAHPLYHSNLSAGVNLSRMCLVPLSLLLSKRAQRLPRSQKRHLARQRNLALHPCPAAGSNLSLSSHNLARSLNRLINRGTLATPHSIPSSFCPPYLQPHSQALLFPLSLSVLLRCPSLSVVPPCSLVLPLSFRCSPLFSPLYPLSFRCSPLFSYVVSPLESGRCFSPPRTGAWAFSG